MAKEAQKKLIIDVDVVIEAYNKKNPELKPLDRKGLAEKLGVNPQILSDWKNGKTPMLIGRIFKLMEIGDVKLNDFIIEKADE
jgi:transcriptional regulator with XRE-family HTH domain